MSDKPEFKIDLHMHTLASGHAYNTIDEMVKEAAKKGMTHIGITEHAPAMPGTCHEFYFQNLSVVPRKRKKLELLLGCEANIVDYDGKIDLPEWILKRLDVVIASMHIPCIKSGTAEENTAAYVNAMKNPYINIIGHPDDGRYPVDYEVLVKTAKETNTLLEINNNSLKPTGPRKNTRENDITILELCKQYEVPVIFGSDAHVKGDIGNFEMIYPLVEETGFPKKLIANSDIELLKKFLRVSRDKR
ncbi:MAG: phosphatase [Lachnospiraceae bacterium]